MTDDTKKYLHYSPIDVWMFNAAPICNVGKYGDITTTRESVTCPDCNRILDALDLPAPVVEMFAELPKIGDVYEFDYVYNERGKTTERLIVVDVTDTHVMYKMPDVSVNKIFPMDYETWKANTDERRKVKTLEDISHVDAWAYSSDKGEAE